MPCPVDPITESLVPVPGLAAVKGDRQHAHLAVEDDLQAIGMEAATARGVREHVKGVHCPGAAPVPKQGAMQQQLACSIEADCVPGHPACCHCHTWNTPQLAFVLTFTTSSNSAAKPSKAGDVLRATVTAAVSQAVSSVVQGGKAFKLLAL